MIRQSWAALLLVSVTACTGGVAVKQQAATCQNPSPQLVSRIVGLAAPGSGFRVEKAAGEKATSKANAWWVGVRFTVGKARTPETGIWAVGGGLTGHGNLMAVSPAAQKWSQAMHADASASQISNTSGTEVLACL